MTTKDVIRVALDLNYHALKMFLADLSDADLLVRPVAGANHTAWQLGHLISSEVQLVEKMGGIVPTELPTGFREQHSKQTSASDSPTGFLTKAEYLALFDKVRAKTHEALNDLPEADLDKPTGWDIAPTMGALLVLVGSHVAMHGGQVTAVRRKLGKPVLF